MEKIIKERICVLHANQKDEYSMQAQLWFFEVLSQQRSVADLLQKLFHAAGSAVPPGTQEKLEMLVRNYPSTNSDGTKR